MLSHCVSVYLFHFFFSESTQNVDTFGSSLRNFSDLTEEHSRHFSYDDLVAITDNFNITKEIGKGGYATVYYGEKNGQVSVLNYCTYK